MAGGDVGWFLLPGGSSGVLPLLHVRDEKASGTHAGASAAAAWQTRTLNTVKTNEITGASLAGNEVTLPAGTYEIEANAPSYSTNRARLRLYDVTGAAALLLGPSRFAETGSETAVAVRGRFSLAGTSTVRVEHYTQTALATFGLGVATNLVGLIEVYAEVLIRKVA